MKRATMALLGLVLLASSSGCCCMDRLFCWGCRGPCAYGHEGPGWGGCGGGGCGGGGCGGGCSDCGGYSGASSGGPMGAGGMAGQAGMSGPGGPGPAGMGGQPGMGGPGMAKRHPAQGHPHAYQRRDAGGDYEFAAGPPTGAVTYPYYTTRGPRDFLARNPRSIGP
jgi:hypothetical protein